MSEQRKQINYAVACVNEFARKYSLSARNAFDYLFKYKAIEFLKENYEIEHTLSFEDAVEDMFLICQKIAEKRGEKTRSFIRFYAYLHKTP